MKVYVVTYLVLDLGRIEFMVDKIFKDEEDAFEYCQQQDGQDRYKINFEVHEIEEIQ